MLHDGASNGDDGLRRQAGGICDGLGIDGGSVGGPQIFDPSIGRCEDELGVQLADARILQPQGAVHTAANEVRPAGQGDLPHRLPWDGKGDEIIHGAPGQRYFLRRIFF